MMSPEAAADSLRGGCANFDFDGYSIEWCESFDQIVFRCEQCDWWFDVEEMSEMTQVCKDCAEWLPTPSSTET